MADNTQRFTGKAEAYERFRERYPAAEVLTRLKDWCGLQPQWAIADVGAGTGMLAEVFLENGNPVIAIEPNEEMRIACERMKPRWPQLEVIDATAEATTLADASVEMVAAGRAFHWFETQLALAEFRRILKPGGWVALVSAGRTDADTEQARDFERLLVELGNDHTYARATYRVHDRLEDLFADLHQAEIPGEQQLDWETLQGFTQSLSIVPRRGSPTFEVFEAGLRTHFERFSHNGILTVQTTCWISAGRLSEAPIPH
jgi:ubiquinone/menaquinone biosynthesis C-methylase UbiE